MELGILFADVRGYTTLAETKPPEEVAQLLNRFYAVATDALCDRDAERIGGGKRGRPAGAGVDSPIDAPQCGTTARGRAN